MNTVKDLESLLYRLDGRGYPAYKEIGGVWKYPGFTLHIDHVQGDPFASPSRLRVVLPSSTAQIPEDLLKSKPRRQGIAWFMARSFVRKAKGISERRGSGTSGLIDMDGPGQEVLEKTCVRISQDGTVEARFFVGLPARGRRILGRQAVEVLIYDLPEIVATCLKAPAHPLEKLKTYAETNEDAEYLRSILPEKGLVGFVADGAVLPRRSGIDDRPLETGVVPFNSPDSLRIEIELPNRGKITGMGIPEGVTLIVGGGFHGKSTLLKALEKGIWNHAYGDGREFVVTRQETVKIRAEDGRSICGVDISQFIGELPGGNTTKNFTTQNASGSTSQAANIIEAIEAGAKVLLLDEDTCATNFMIRDRRMQELIEKSREPITPFVDVVKGLYKDLGISTVLVMGGSGDYFDVADLVIAMDSYIPKDVTKRAKEISLSIPTGRISEAKESVSKPKARVPLKASIDPSKGKREVSLKSRGLHIILIGRETIDLKLWEQLVDSSQTKAIGLALVWLWENGIDGQKTIPELLDIIDKEIKEKGLDILDRRKLGDLAEFRPIDLAAAVNRLRTLKIKEAPNSF